MQVSTAAPVKTGDYGFWFADPSRQDFGPDGPQRIGQLVSPKFTVGDETEMKFTTWWEHLFGFSSCDFF